MIAALIVVGFFIFYVTMGLVTVKHYAPQIASNNTTIAGTKKFQHKNQYWNHTYIEPGYTLAKPEKWELVKTYQHDTLNKNAMKEEMLKFFLLWFIMVPSTIFDNKVEKFVSKYDPEVEIKLRLQLEASEKENEEYRRREQEEFDKQFELAQPAKKRRRFW